MYIGGGILTGSECMHVCNAMHIALMLSILAVLGELCTHICIFILVFIYSCIFLKIRHKYFANVREMSTDEMICESKLL